MENTIITEAYQRDVLEGSLSGLAPDTEGLYDAIRAVLNNNPSIVQASRVISHLKEDDFDFCSNDAHDAADVLEVYRVTYLLNLR